MTASSANSRSVLVGIVTHNRPQELAKAIKSAFAQSHRPLRVAVIDDASTDDTPLLHEHFRSVSWESRKQPEGYVRARNHMMLNSDETYYASLDDDAWFLDGDELAVAVAFLDRHPNVAAVAYDILSPDRPERMPRAKGSPTPLFIGCGHVLRLSAVKELGGYVEFPGSYGGEEKEFCLRLMDAGYEIVKIDGLHVWHDKTMRARDLAKQYRSLVCNDFVIAWWRAPLILLVPMLAWKLGRHLVFAVRFNLLSAWMRGIGDFVATSHVTARGRAPIRLATFSRYRALSRTGRVDRAI
jgi:GT2 family glycosyltransferase